MSWFNVKITQCMYTYTKIHACIYVSTTNELMYTCINVFYVYSSCLQIPVILIANECELNVWYIEFLKLINIHVCWIIMITIMINDCNC